MSNTLIPGIGAGTLLESILLEDQNSVRVGAIHRLGFDDAIVLTHDRWKHDAGGIARHSFLLATARDVTSAGFDDDEVLLLRVEGSAPLAMESDLLAVREESLRSALASHADPSPSVVLDMSLDPFTKDRVSYTGLRCKILGTFYEDDHHGKRYLAFGSDLDNFYATSTYRVLKPVGGGLEFVASYLKVNPAERVEPVRLGTVRFSSTRRRAKQSGQSEAAVKVNILDFIGQKTGMFGMTRMGKSNTMKTVVARTQVVSQRQISSGGESIGQLILDPQGEYANPNAQDGTEIAAIGAEQVAIYKFGGSTTQENVRPLGINFFDPAQVQFAKVMISSALADAGADYVRAFVNADFEGVRLAGESEGDGFQRLARAERGRLMLYGALAKADFAVPQRNPSDGRPYVISLPMKAEVAEAINLAHPNAVRVGQRGRVSVSRESLVDVCDWLSDAVADPPDPFPGENAKTRQFNEGLESIGSGDPFRAALPIFTQSNQSRFVSGYTKLIPLRPFHDAQSTSDYRDEIYGELVAGRIVIVDLHLGPHAVISKLSEELAHKILERQTDRFTEGDDAPKVQIVLEEAHNLFNSKSYGDELDVWVRLAKEAAKLNIGMIYATQEVSGVAHEVLANTKNWVVAHLNNSKELSHLGQFYDFSDFGEDILAAEDRGFVRLKTMSSPYIVPVQIDHYGIDLVNEARVAAGDAPLVVEQTLDLSTSDESGGTPSAGVQNGR